jgi:hypothetical protein
METRYRDVNPADLYLQAASGPHDRERGLLAKNLGEVTARAHVKHNEYRGWEIGGQVR